MRGQWPASSARVCSSMSGAKYMGPSSVVPNGSGRMQLHHEREDRGGRRDGHDRAGAPGGARLPGGDPRRRVRAARAPEARPARVRRRMSRFASW